MGGASWRGCITAPAFRRRLRLRTLVDAFPKVRGRADDETASDCCDGYPWLKALHVACALLFVGGVVASGLLLAAGHVAGARVAPILRRWDRMITVPAMLGVWAFGICLAASGGWFTYGWLQAKLVLVVFLSAIHGLQSGQLRRLAAGTVVKPLRAAAIVVPSVIAIAVLAVIKP